MAAAAAKDLLDAAQRFRRLPSVADAFPASAAAVDTVIRALDSEGASDLARRGRRKCALTRDDRHRLLKRIRRQSVQRASSERRYQEELAAHSSGLINFTRVIQAAFSPSKRIPAQRRPHV